MTVMHRDALPGPVPLSSGIGALSCARGGAAWVLGPASPPPSLPLYGERAGDR